MSLKQSSRQRRELATYADKAKRRPIPRNPEQWQREIDGIGRFLQGMGGIDMTIDAQWLKNMVAYYHARLAYLLANPPL